MTELDFDEGWTGGYTVHMRDGWETSVLGPDGEPVRMIRRHKAGFDLRPRKPTPNKETDT